MKNANFYLLRIEFLLALILKKKNKGIKTTMKIKTGTNKTIEYL